MRLLLLFIFLISNLFTLSVYAQDKFGQPACSGLSVQEQSELHEKAKRFYSKIPQLKQWAEEQTGQPLKLQNGHVLFSWPLKIDAQYDDIPVYYNTWFYWDMAAGATIRDWKCSNKAYDGHNGVDIAPYPFWWHMKDNNYLYAAAAESGLVVDVTIHHADENCLLPNVSANRITILHADSSITSYLHLKTNSALVAEEQFVSEGQLLASIGSSGRSACPHLHFMVADKNGNNIEPYTGTNPDTDCNTMNEDSWWKSQKPHYDPKLNRVMTHHGSFTTYGSGNDKWCRSEENRFAKNNFNANDSIYVGIFIADMVPNSTTSFGVYRPDGSVWQSGTLSYMADSVPIYFYRFAYKLPSNAQTGTWKINVSFRGQGETHYFTVNCTANYTLTNESGSYGYIASNGIESSTTATSGNKVLLQAANNITLKPGFHALSGTTFKARIRDCNFSE
jgi:murein DD-endopeptidase MepM/ murein hydrolase activator NlpD